MTGFTSPAPVAVLRAYTARLIHVDFDVTNPEHIAAYVCLTKYGRQHPTLRFNLYEQFENVHSMMNTVIGATYAAQFPTADSIACVAIGKKLE